MEHFSKPSCNVSLIVRRWWEWARAWSFEWGSHFVTSFFLVKLWSFWSTFDQYFLKTLSLTSKSMNTNYRLCKFIHLENIKKWRFRPLILLKLVKKMNPILYTVDALISPGRGIIIGGGGAGGVTNTILRSSSTQIIFFSKIKLLRKLLLISKDLNTKLPWQRCKSLMVSKMVPSLEK